MLNDKSHNPPASAATLAMGDRLPRPSRAEPALRRTGRWGGWPFFVRILLWATRNNRTSVGPSGARRPNVPLQDVPMSDSRAISSISVRIWDRPVRIVHWAMALLVPLAWWAAVTGHMAWHYRFGYALLGLLVFRLTWGFAGSSTARFASFVRSPRRVIDYLRGRHEHVHGHNPLGALSIVALLAVLAIQICTGLFAMNGNGRKAGPFADLIAPSAAQAVAKLHMANFNLLLALIGLHVAAVLFYLLVRRDNLIAPMLTGRRPAPAGTRPMTPAPVSRLVIATAVAAAVTAGLVAAFWR